LMFNNWLKSGSRIDPSLVGICGGLSAISSLVEPV